MPQIKSLHAREILDSRGNPTVAVTVHLNNGISAEAAVPSGASTGQHEALELRDRDPARYRGAGVRQAVAHVNGELAAALAGLPVSDQERLDSTMCRLDGTPNKSRLGANAMLGVSLAAARAAAAAAGIPLYQHLGGQEACTLPVPMINVLNAGCHSSAPIAFQEFMLRPVGLPNFREAVRAGAEIFQALRSLLKKRGFSTAVGDEGGFAPTLAGGTREALELLLEAIGSAGYVPGRDITLALDCAASEFYRDGLYDYTLFEGQDAARRDPDAQADFLQSLIDAYPIDSIEDGMAEEDWDGWKLLTERVGHQCQLVGDDLFVTNVEFLGRGIARAIANAILIKVNQIGTLSETMDAIRMAEKAGYGVVISHRSGETEDTTIADLAVAVNAGQIKCGSLSRSERVAKYNRLLWIEEQLGSRARYGRKP